MKIKQCVTWSLFLFSTTVFTSEISEFKDMSYEQKWDDIEVRTEVLQTKLENGWYMSESYIKRLIADSRILLKEITQLGWGGEFKEHNADPDSPYKILKTNIKLLEELFDKLRINPVHQFLKVQRIISRHPLISY